MRRYRIFEGGIDPHFVTWSLVDWLPVFSTNRYCRIMADSLAFCRAEKGLLVHAYVVMLTHMHAILSAGNGADLSAIIRDLRKFTAKQIVQCLQQDGNSLFDWVFRDAARKDGRPQGSYKVWQSQTHPETLLSKDFLLQKLEYLHNNPVRKGLVELPEHWTYSSAPFYVLGRQDGPLEIDALEW
jgi:REP element-mobilizing transposase RayT